MSLTLFFVSHSLTSRKPDKPIASYFLLRMPGWRDLFTSPAVFFSFERGWRQGFAQAGFPGPYIEVKSGPAVAPWDFSKSVVVGMS